MPMSTGVAPDSWVAYTENTGISKNKPSMRKENSAAMGKTVLDQGAFIGTLIQFAMCKWYKVQVAYTSNTCKELD